MATANYDFDTTGIQHHRLSYQYDQVETVFKFNLEDGLEHKRGESSASREAAGNNLTFPDKSDVVWTSLIPTPNREELLSQYRAVKENVGWALPIRRLPDVSLWAMPTLLFRRPKKRQSSGAKHGLAVEFGSLVSGATIYCFANSVATRIRAW